MYIVMYFTQPTDFFFLLIFGTQEKRMEKKMTIDDPLGFYLQHMKVWLVTNLPWTTRYLDERVGQDHMAS